MNEFWKGINEEIFQYGVEEFVEKPLVEQGTAGNLERKERVRLHS